MMPLPPEHLSVVHLLAPAPFGGLESVVQSLACGQAAGGDSVCVAVVVSADEKGHPLVDALDARGIDTTVLRIGARAYLRERRAVRDVLLQRGAQVLHTHGYRPDVVDAPVARGMGVATVTTVHGYTGGGLKNRLYEWLQTRAFRRFDAVIAVSWKLHDELLAKGVPSQRLHVLANAWQANGDVASRAEARSALGLGQEGTIVAWVGRMSREKAPDLMVRAFAAMPDDGTRLSMIGTGPLETESRRLAADLGVASRITWHGVVPAAGRYLRAYDAVVLTSRTEGTPIVLLEAMAAEVPVVTTAVGGIPDVVGDREAMLVPAGDASAIASAVAETLANRPAASRRAAEAKRHLESDLTVDRWVARHREIYASLLGQDGRSR